MSRICSNSICRCNSKVPHAVSDDVVELAQMQYPTKHYTHFPMISEDNHYIMFHLLVSAEVQVSLQSMVIHIQAPVAVVVAVVVLVLVLVLVVQAAVAVLVLVVQAAVQAAVQGGGGGGGGARITNKFL